MQPETTIYFFDAKVHTIRFTLRVTDHKDEHWTYYTDYLQNLVLYLTFHYYFK